MLAKFTHFQKHRNVQFQHFITPLCLRSFCSLKKNSNIKINSLGGFNYSSNRFVPFPKKPQKTLKFRRREREIFLAKSISKLVAGAQLCEYEYLGDSLPQKSPKASAWLNSRQNQFFSVTGTEFSTGSGCCKTTYHKKYITKNNRENKKTKKKTLNKNTINNYSTNEPGKLSTGHVGDKFIKIQMLSAFRRASCTGFTFNGLPWPNPPPITCFFDSPRQLQVWSSFCFRFYLLFGQLIG